MKFEDVLDYHKRELTEALVFFGEADRVIKIIIDVERSRADFYKFYKAGQMSNQHKVSELELNYNQLKLMYDEAIKCLMESNYGDVGYLTRRGVIK